MSTFIVLPPLPEHTWLVVPLVTTVRLIYSPDPDRDRGELAQCDWFSAGEVPKSTVVPPNIGDYIRAHINDIEAAAERNIVSIVASNLIPPVPVIMRCCNGACRNELNAVELMGTSGQSVQRSIGWDGEKQNIVRIITYAFSCRDNTLCYVATRAEFQNHAKRIRQNHPDITFRRACVVCGRKDDVGPRFRRCGACHDTCYCGDKCQAIHWPHHKPTCEALVKQKRTIPKRCLSCNRRETTEEPLRSCARCHWAFYCNTTCQRDDWPDHKHDCQT